MTDKPLEQNLSVAKKTPKRFLSRRLGWFFVILILVGMLIAFSCHYLYLTNKSQTLSKEMHVMQDKLMQQQNQLVSLHKEMSTVVETLQTVQTHVTKQDNFMSEWRALQQSDTEKWLFEEAKHLVVMANDQLRVMQNVSLAVMLLQNADQLVQKLHDARAVPLHEALSADLARLQLLPEIDTTALFARLSALKQQLSQLPLPASPLQASTPETMKVNDQKLSWWRAGLAHSWEALQKIVIVRYNPGHTLPLILPEEKNFLLLNLNMQIENAIWGVLHRDTLVYERSLSQISLWAQKYFVQDNPLTQAFLQNVQALRGMIVQISVPTLTSLPLFSIDLTAALPEQNTRDQTIQAPLLP
jgi:uroporphyrin-3 C-methyltransferase